jgi:hypothetical protein
MNKQIRKAEYIYPAFFDAPVEQSVNPFLVLAFERRL